MARDAKAGDNPGYAVPTKALNQAVKRNAARFPSDFVFQLLPREMAELRSQFVTAGEQDPARQYDGALRSQFVTLKPGRGRHRKYLPWAFTEHGAIMAATVLNSPRAVSMSLYVVRTFIQTSAMPSTSYNRPSTPRRHHI